MSLRGERAATSVLFFANGFGFGGWSAAIAPLKGALRLSDGQLGLLLFTLAAGAVSFMPLAGAAGPRLGGTGPVSVRAGLVFGACFALAGLAPGAWTLALVGLGIGASNGLMDVTMNAHASGVERRWGSPIMSSFHAAFSVGGLAGAGFGAASLALGLGWRGLLIGLAAGSPRWSPAQRRGLGPGERPKTTQSPFGWPPRALIGLAVVAFLCFLVEGAMIDWDGVYLVSLGVGPAAAPLGYAAFAATMIAGRLAGDRIVARLGRMPTVIAGATLAFGRPRARRPLAGRFSRPRRASRRSAPASPMSCRRCSAKAPSTPPVPRAASRRLRPPAIRACSPARRSWERSPRFPICARPSPCWRRWR